MPPIHMPFFLEAAILSRMRSPVTSRSNWAKDNSTFSVSRPMRGRGVELLGDRDEGDAVAVEDVDDLGEVGRASASAGRPCRRRPRRSGRPRCRPAAACRAGRSSVPPEKPPSSYSVGSTVQPSCFLRANEGGAGLALGIERVEVLLEAFLRSICACRSRSGPLWRSAAKAFPTHPSRSPWFGRSAAAAGSPKKRGPDQCAPVIFLAIVVSDG